MVSKVAVCFVFFVLLLNSSKARNSGDYAGKYWQNAQATFYGGSEDPNIKVGAPSLDLFYNGSKFNVYSVIKFTNDPPWEKPPCAYCDLITPISFKEVEY